MSIPGSAAPVARLRGVGQRYGRTVALDGIDLEVAAGRMVGLIGPDGVGKSSLLALVAGARAVQQGTVEVLGGGDSERAVVNRSVDEAVDSAVALLHRLKDVTAEGPRVPFGGLVVEWYERSSEVRAQPGAEPARAAVH